MFSLRNIGSAESVLALSEGTFEMYYGENSNAYS